MRAPSMVENGEFILDEIKEENVLRKKYTNQGKDNESLVSIIPLKYLNNLKIRMMINLNRARKATPSHSQNLLSRETFTRKMTSAR